MYIDRLKYFEYRNGFKQCDAAKFLGISEGLYSRYKNEKQIFPIKKLIRLCDFYNISLDYIFNFNNDYQYQNLTKNINVNLLCKRIKMFRKENKLTQEKLAIILNVGKGTIAEYEKGRYILSTYSLYVICHQYRISADYLLGRINSPKYLK